MTRVLGDELTERFPFFVFVSNTGTLEPRQGQPTAAAAARTHTI